MIQCRNFHHWVLWTKEIERERHFSFFQKSSKMRDQWNSHWSCDIIHHRHLSRAIPGASFTDSCKLYWIKCIVGHAARVVKDNCSFSHQFNFVCKKLMSVFAFHRSPETWIYNKGPLKTFTSSKWYLGPSYKETLKQLYCVCV